MTVTGLRARAEAEAARLPPLLAQAMRLAGSVATGEHGRRRAGAGDDFWQYRPLQPGDSLQQIDWRRSARSDAEFLRQREWKISQAVTLWVDGSAAMRFSSSPKDLPEKLERARLIALALAVVLNRGGERVGLANAALAPRGGAAQITRIAMALTESTDEEFGAPQCELLSPHGRAVFVSDFMGPLSAVQKALTEAADRNVRGVLLQVLDPAELSFPYRSRMIFESPMRQTHYETRKADALRTRYLQRLAERQDALRQIARKTGWVYHVHRTDQSAQSALIWLWQMLSQNGGT